MQTPLSDIFTLSQDNGIECHFQSVSSLLVISKQAARRAAACKLRLHIAPTCLVCWRPKVQDHNISFNALRWRSSIIMKHDCNMRCPKLFNVPVPPKTSPVHHLSDGFVDFFTSWKWMVRWVVIIVAVTTPRTRLVFVLL